MVHPLLSTLDAVDHVFLMLMQESCPLGVSLEVGCVADDYQAMSGPSDCHIDPVVLLDESSRLSANHSNEDDIKLAALGRVDRDNLFLHVHLNKLIHNGILLSIVRSDNVDILFLEAKLWNLLYLLVDF